MTEASLAYARQFVPYQIMLSCVRCHEGMLQICCEDGRVLEVGLDDAVVLCTGQRAAGGTRGTAVEVADV